MTVQARFWIANITHHAFQAGAPADAAAATIEMQPVYGDGENAAWSKHTPHGKIEMTVTNPAAIDQFEIGATYELSFAKVGKE